MCRKLSSHHSEALERTIWNADILAYGMTTGILDLWLHWLDIPVVIMGEQASPEQVETRKVSELGSEYHHQLPERKHTISLGLRSCTCEISTWCDTGLLHRNDKFPMSSCNPGGLSKIICWLNPACRDLFNWLSIDMQGCLKCSIAPCLASSYHSRKVSSRSPAISASPTWVSQRPYWVSSHLTQYIRLRWHLLHTQLCIKSTFHAESLNNWILAKDN